MNLGEDVLERDVLDDLVRTIRDMNSVRSEVIDGNEIFPQRKDRYLVSAETLAEKLVQLSDDAMLADIKTIQKKLERNPDLGQYDPIHKGVVKAKRFIRSLDDLTIKTLRDNYGIPDASHHVLQAIKFLSVKDKDPAEQREMYDTIQPFFGAAPVTNLNSWWQTAAALVLGDSYEIVAIDETTVKVTGDPQFLEDMVEDARIRGYSKVQIDVEKSLLKSIKQQYTGSKKIGNVKAKPSKTNKFLDQLIGKTKYVSHTLLGALPGSLQERLDKKFDSYSSEDAMTISPNVECAAGILGLVASACALFTAPPIALLTLPSILLIPDSIIRQSKSYYKISHWKKEFDGPVGSVFVKPFTQVFEPIGEPETMITVEIPTNLEKRHEATKRVNYETIAKLDVPHEYESNLVWGPGNHNNFGQSFLRYVKGELTSPTESVIDLDSSSVIFYEAQEIGSYHRINSVVCRQGERLLITTITTDNDFIPHLQEFMKEYSTPEKLTELLTKDSQYLQVRKFEDGNQTFDSRM